jgi:hypothetical protein
MKDIIFIGLAVLLIVSSCGSNEQESFIPTPTLGVTREQVVAIATKYNLQDSIAEGYVSPHFKPFPPEVYPILTEAFWDSYFKQWRKFADKNNDFMQFRKEISQISSMEEYYQVIEKHPEEYASRVKLGGGIDAYNAEKEERLNGNYHIYLCNDGAIAIIPGETDKGTMKGKRLDKK